MGEPDRADAGLASCIDRAVARRGDLHLAQADAAYCPRRHRHGARRRPPRLSHHGGGISLFDANAVATNVVVAGNTAMSDGAGLYIYGNSLTLTNATVVGNHGAGITLRTLAPCTLDNAISARNDGPGFDASGSMVPTVEFSDAFGNAGGDFVGFATSPMGMMGNLAADLGFVSSTGSDPTTWDLHLSAGSPLIHAGDPAVINRDGTRSDLGAYGGPGAAL